MKSLPLAPQIILLDSSALAASKSTLISALRSAIGNLRIVMVDMDSDEKQFMNAIRAGVVGYVLKDASAAEVAGTISAVAAGKGVCPPSLCMALFRFVMLQADPPRPTPWGFGLGLSRRELELAELLGHRLSNKEIALRLNLSEQTVKNHVHHILRKVGARNRLHVAEYYEAWLCGSESLSPSRIHPTRGELSAPSSDIGFCEFSRSGTPAPKRLARCEARTPIAERYA